MQMELFEEQFTPIKSTDWKWRLSDGYPESNELKVFSCFACGGGSTMGYKLAGCEVLGCVEIDKRMNNLYVENHHPRFNYCEDIREFNKRDDLPPELYDLDILDGSPPCTTFSMAGEREASWGVKKKFAEGQAEQTLDDLSFVFIETAKKLRPKCVIMENVEGLIQGEAWSYVQRIYSEFTQAGYTVAHWLCKGELMGVPQTRHRVFFIAVRKDLNFDPNKIDLNFNYAPIPYGQIKEGEGQPLNPDTEIYRWLIRAEPCDKRIGDVVTRYGFKEKLFNHRICWPNKVMQTIASAGLMLRGEEKTNISKEDVIHSQTFPEDYQFGGGGYNAVVYICGMSVPPIMMKRIVFRVIETGIFSTNVVSLVPCKRDAS